MATQIRLKDISQSSVLEAQQWLIAVLTEKFPEYNFTSGAVYGLIVLPHAIAGGAIQALIEKVKQSQSLYTASKASEIDKESITALLDNFGITLQTASVATGKVRIALTEDVLTHIAIGDSFTDPQGKMFVVTKNVFAYPTTTATIGEDDVRLEKVGTYYYFSVPVRAEIAGREGNIEKNTPLTPTTPIRYLHSAVAEATFTGGRDDETIQEAINRVYLSRNAALIGGNLQLQSYFKLKAQDDDILKYLDSVISVSRVGSHSPFMMRDRRGIFPISIGGKEDIYVKTATYPDYKLVQENAKLIAIQPNGDGVWRAVLGREHVAGAYDVSLVLPISGQGTGYTVSNFVIMPDTSGGGHVPDIENGLEAAFSAFQSFVVDFVDTHTPVTVEQIGVRTAPYLFRINYLPYISEIHSFLCSEEVWPPFLDFLVRACIPAYLSIQITVSNVVEPDLVFTIKNVIREYIGNLQIGSTIYASQLASLIRPLLPGTVDIRQIRLTANILGINTNRLTIGPATTYLEIPTDLESGVSPQTTGWFVNADNITFVT